MYRVITGTEHFLVLFEEQGDSVTMHYIRLNMVLIYNKFEKNNSRFRWSFTKWIHRYFFNTTGNDPKHILPARGQNKYLLWQGFGCLDALMFWLWIT